VIRDIRFGRYRLHPVQGLSRGNLAIHLTPKSLALLQMLVSRAGELVTKDELFQEVWPRLVVTDASLTTCIQELRTALQDDARKPRFIETVHRRGYRFISRITAVGADGAAALTSTSPAAPAPIFGREAALELLMTALARAREGVRQVVFVSGEAGIGKTALAETFIARVAPRSDVHVTGGECMEHYGAGEAYQPLLDALSRLCRGREQTIATLRKVAPTWLAQLPALQTSAEFRALQRRTAGATRDRMLRELTDALEVITESAGLVLHIEDLHWSDVSTLDWVSAFARRREPARVLVIATLRSADARVNTAPIHAMIDELRLKGLCQVLTLGGLDEAAVVQCVTECYPPAAEQRVGLENLARLVRQHTDGNPLFIVNVLRDLATRGLLVERQGAWSVQAGIDAASLRIPDDIRRIIEQQCDRLAPQERELLTVASACGGACTAAAVAAGAAVAVPQAETTLGGLARQSLFLRELETARWPDGTVTANFEFLHALYREVLGARVRPARAAEIHHRIGSRLEAAYGAQAREIAAELAMHFDRAHDLERAITYLRHAAGIDQARSAHREAHAHLRRALELLEAQPPSLERDEREVALRIGLGGVLVATHGFGAPEVESCYSRARELCGRLGSTGQSFPVLWGLWLYYLDRGPLDTSRELADGLSSLADKLGDPSLALQAHHAQWATMFSLGDMAATAEHARHGIALYDSHQHAGMESAYGSHDPGVCAHNFAARAAVLGGDPRTAVQASERGIAQARELGHPFSLALALVFAAFTRQAMRDVAAARECALAANVISREHGFVLMHGWAGIVEGWAAVETGEVERGITLMREGIARAGSKGSSLFLAQMLGMLGEAELKGARLNDARNSLDAAFAQVARTGERIALPELERAAGELALASGTDDDARRRAEAHLRAGVERAREQRARLLELRASVRLGRTWLADGKRDDARELVQRACAGVPHAEELPDVQEARELLSEC
jgi:DNA-binding winged helix-turn-helix (wHTH) protein/predicted ATPase